MADKRKSVEPKRNFFQEPTEKDPSERWEEIQALLIHRLVVLATRARCAVLFGVSKDGGIPTLVLLYGTEKQSHYVRPSDDLEDLVRHYIEFFEGRLEE